MGGPAAGAADGNCGHGQRLKAENDQLRQEISLLREELRVKDIRTVRIPPHKRPHYPPTERMAILELRAARGWSLEQTAEAFLLTSPTVACWGKRLDEEGPDALVQIREPVNKFPDFVRYAVGRPKTLCPRGVCSPFSCFPFSLLIRSALTRREQTQPT